MRFFKLNKDYHFNWRYVLGEVFLIFVGINLAIWFNNWNTNKTADRNKAAAIAKISEEIRDNLSDLESVYDKNNKVLDAYNAYKPFYNEDTSELIATSEERAALDKKHPDFFQVIDSAEVENLIYKYSGKTYVKIELSDLSEIAWNTSNAISVTNEFSYDCLYGLESLYNLQRRVQKEINKASDALQKRQLKELVNILSFCNKLMEQLVTNYNEVLQSIDECQ